MKIMKKLAMLVLTLCLTVSAFDMLTYAAEGRILFSDPTGKVGETLQVRGAIQVETEAEDIEFARIVMTYDTEMLKFIDGSDVTEDEPGVLTYKGSGAEKLRYTMNFDVLKGGTTKIEIKVYEARTASDDSMICRQGSSTITIEGGEVVDPEEPIVQEPTDGATVDINGKAYTFVSLFDSAEIPEGYTESTLEYDDAEYKVVQNETTGICLGYLVDANGEGGFFLYNEEDATFSPYAEFTISESTSIVLLKDVEGIVLPEEYAETTITVNDYEFPAWKNTENTDFCILYAMNSNGEAVLYQLDYAEGTYQRFDAPEVEEKDDSMIGKLSALLENHLDILILGTGVGLVFFIILVIVLGVKLHNRNAELDELYDELGIDEEEPVKEEKKQPEKEDFVKIDDVVEEDIILEEKYFEDEPEIEVEFFEEKLDVEEVKEVVQEAVKEIELEPIVEVAEEVQKTSKEDGATKIMKIEEVKAAMAKNTAKVDFIDDEDDDLGFEIDFIDLDD